MKISEVKILHGDNLKPCTPEVLAELFAHMYSDEQAAFFNHVAVVASDWSWPMQLQYLTDEQGLNLQGRQVMQSIGEYSHWGLVPRVDYSFLEGIDDDA